MVPYIVEHTDPGSSKLVVATSCLDLLSERFRNFKLVVDYDPLEPAEEDRLIHRIWEAKKRARINTLNNAAEATRNGWGCGPAECYRSAIGKAGLEAELERAILNWDIQVSYPHIYLPKYLLITVSIPILGSLSISRKPSCSYV